MPTPKSLLHTAAKKIAENLDTLPFANFISLSNAIKKDAELFAPIVEILLKTTDKNILPIVLNLLLEEKNLPALKIDENVDKWLTQLDDLISHNRNKLEITALALAVKLKLMRACSTYNQEKFDLNLTLQQLALMGELSHGSLELLIKILLAKLIDDRHAYAHITQDIPVTILWGEQEWLFPYHNEAQRQVVLTNIMTHLKEQDEFVRSQATKTCFYFFPHLSESENKALFTTLLDNFKDEAFSVRRATITTCLFLFPYFNESQREAIFHPILTCCKDSDDLVRNTSIQACTSLFPHLDETKRKMVFTCLLVCFQDTEYHVRRETIRAFASLLPLLNETERATALEQIRACFQDQEISVSYTAAGVVFPHINEDERERILTCLFTDFQNWSTCEEAIIACVSLFPHLNTYECKTVLATLLSSLRSAPPFTHEALLRACASLFPRLDDLQREIVLAVTLIEFSKSIDDYSTVSEVCVALFTHLNDTQRDTVFTHLLNYFTKHTRETSAIMGAWKDLVPNLNKTQRELMFTAILTYFPKANLFEKDEATEAFISLFPYLAQNQQQQILSLLKGEASKIKVLIPLLNFTQCEFLKTTARFNDTEFTELTAAITAHNSNQSLKEASLPLDQKEQTIKQRAPIHFFPPKKKELNEEGPTTSENVEPLDSPRMY